MRYQCESKSWNSRDLIRKGKSASRLSETRNLPLCVETKQSKNTFWKSEDLLQLPDGGNMAIPLLWAAESLSRGEGSTDPDCNVWWSVWRLFLFFFFPLSYFRYIPQKDPCSLPRTTAPEARTLMASPGAVLNLALSCLFSGFSCILCHVHFTFSDTSCRFGGGWGLFLGFFPFSSTAVRWGLLDPSTKKPDRKLPRASGCGRQSRAIVFLMALPLQRDLFLPLQWSLVLCQHQVLEGTCKTTRSMP